VAYTVGAVIAAATTILGIAVLVTDGAVIDQPGRSGEDWAFSAAIAVLSLVLVPTAVLRIRRLRRSRQRERADLEPDGGQGETVE
jgi:ABC-type spermidine/putrescine transport system permease subunit I